jgi:hypothetical protein
VPLQCHRKANDTAKPPQLAREQIQAKRRQVGISLKISLCIVLVNEYII